MKSMRTWNAKNRSVSVVRYENATWMTCGTTCPPISWMGLCATSAANVSLASAWQRPQVSFLELADTAEAASVFATMACVPPCAFGAAWQLVHTGASSFPTRTSRPWIESW